MAEVLRPGEQEAIDQAGMANDEARRGKTPPKRDYDPRLSDTKASVATVEGGPKISDYPGADSGNISARAKYDKAVRDYKRDHPSQSTRVLDAALTKVNGQ